MLRIDETFRQEVSAARNWRDKHLMHWKAMKERFTGPAYRHENYVEGADIENIVGQYVSLVLPRVAYDYPRIHVTANGQSVLPYDRHCKNSQLICVCFGVLLWLPQNQ